ncbi:MAG: endonuclease/exonuclease/phosphatase family protein [Acidimicrobiales bacterium]
MRPHRLTTACALSAAVLALGACSSGATDDAASTTTTASAATSGSAGTNAGTGGSIGSATADADSGEFVALAYNVAGLPEVLSGSEPATNMPQIGPKLNAYDLVLVQESWKTPDPNPYAPMRGYHEELEATSELEHRSTPATQPLGTDATRPEALLADGLNRFSRFAFGDVTRVRWEGCFGGADTSDRGAADCLATKGFSVATTTLADGVEVDVYNLHAEAGSSDRDQELQAADFAQLAAFINEHSAGKAIILGGDTNLHTDEVPENPQDEADAGIWETFLADTGLSDVCTTLDCPEPGRIDKFAYRSGGGVTLEPLSWNFETDVFVRDDGEPLSDHEALAVRFSWQRD